MAKRKNIRPKMSASKAPTVADLRAEAKAAGLKGYSRLNKAGLTELLATQKGPAKSVTATVAKKDVPLTSYQKRFKAPPKQIAHGRYSDGSLLPGYTSKGRNQLIKEARAKGVKDIGGMETEKLAKKLGYKGLAGLSLLAAPVVASAIAFDATRNQALASGKGGGQANVDATKAAVVAGGVTAGIAGGIIGGIKLASKIAPTVGKIASRSLLPLTAAFAAYEIGSGAVSGYRTGGAAGALKGAGEGALNFATFGGYDYLKHRGETPNPTGGRAYLNADAAKKATLLVAASPSMPHPAVAASGAGRVSYTTKDGRAVTGTKSQVEHWRSQRKS